MLPEGLPEKTLGWQILDWCSTYLAQPDGIHRGDNFIFTPEQARFILHWYALNPDGSFTFFRKAVLERPKGWGKSPFIAAIAAAELIGPTLFAGWDANGEPVGRPDYNPLVQIAAISDSQAENTMAPLREMLAEGDAYDDYSLDIGLTRIIAPGNRRLEKVTASPRGREGNPATFIVCDETHLWVPAERGPELYSALTRNLTKKNRRWVETTNAPVPGEDSVAEMTHNAYERQQAGKTFDKGMLFDTREVVVNNIYDPDEAYPALEYVYGDSMIKKNEDGEILSGWMTLERVFADINDDQMSETTARRFFFNQRISGHPGWIKPEIWDGAQRDVKPLRPADKITLGFKGSSVGSASIVAFRITDGALFTVANWERPTGAKYWKVPKKEVKKALLKYLNRENCYYLFACPQNWQDVLSDVYAEEDEKVVEFWTTSLMKMAHAVEQFETAVETDGVCHDGDETLRRHILHCHTEEVTQGIVIRKETAQSTRWITAAQAAVLAMEAGMKAIEEGALVDVDNRLYSF